MQVAERTAQYYEERQTLSGPPVSCVIVAFHRTREVNDLVRSLLDDRIQIVVVNVEDDPRIQHVRGARVIGTAANVGYAAGVNVGVALAHSDVVVFMNDDVVTTARDVLRLADRVHEGHADAAVPLVAHVSGHLELGNRPPLRLAKRMLLKGMDVPSQPFPVDAAWAAMVAVRADLIRAIPMPEGYFLYWEEFDWFYRLRQRGARVELNPTVRVSHPTGPGDVRPEKSRLLARNAVRCVRRTRGRAAALRAWPVVIFWQVDLVLRSLLARRGRRARAHAAGVWAALGSWREV